MDHNLYQGVGMLSYSWALISSNEIASWTYIIVAIVSMIAGLISIIYNIIKWIKDDNKIDDQEKQELIEQIKSLEQRLEDINNNKPGN